MQLSLINPAEYPVVTQQMHDDPDLKAAIKFVRSSAGVAGGETRRAGFDWPHAEALTTVNGRMAWAVDDHGKRYVAVGRTVFRADDIRFASARVRTAAAAAFARLDGSLK